MLRRVALVRTEVLEERSSSIISVRPLPVTAYVVPNSTIVVTPMTEALGFSVTSVLTRATGHNIQDDDILHSHRRETLKSYIALTGWTL
jgi:hypothetical protein